DQSRASLRSGTRRWTADRWFGASTTVLSGYGDVSRRNASERSETFSHERDKLYCPVLSDCRHFSRVVVDRLAGCESGGAFSRSPRQGHRARDATEEARLDVRVRTARLFRR